MLKMVDGTGIIGVDMICPLGVSTPQPPNYDRVELEGTGMLVLPNSLDAPLERLELGGKTEQVQTSGKNLANANVYEQGYLTSVNAGDKVSLTQMQKSFTTNMEVSSMQGKNVSVSVRTKEKTGKKYVFTDETDTIITGVFDTGSNNYSEFKNITIPKNAKKLFFSVTYDAQENTELQVELGTTVTTYEPYTGGKPSPSPEYPQEIKNSGKWNEEKQKYEVDVKVSNCGYLQKGSYADKIRPLPLEKGKTYRIYVDVKSAVVNVGILNEERTFVSSGELYSYYNSRGYPINSTGVVSGICRLPNLLYRGYTFTVTVDGLFLYQGVNANILNTDNAYVAYDFIKKVDISSPYTEKESVVLTSDRPITKWDRLVEQGGEIGWLYNSVNETIDGKTGKWSIQPASKIFYRTDIAFPIAVPFCSELLGYDYSSVGYKKDTGISINNLGILCITLPEEVELTLDAYKQYLADNPLHVLYKTETTEFVPLPQSEQNAIRALKTYYPTTVITVDGGELDPDIKVTYRKEI